MLKHRAVVFQMIGGLVLAVPAAPALAQSNPSPVSPMSLQVAGIGLGMSVADSVAALQKFDPSYKIEKFYQNTNVSQYPVQGTPIANIPTISTDDMALPQKYAFLTDLTATDGTDSVHVWYDPVPDHEKVIAVLRQEQYQPQPDAEQQMEQENPLLFATMQHNAQPQAEQTKAPQLPALSTILAGIAGKYPYPYTLRSADNLNTDWLFDAKERLMSPDRARQLGLEGWGGDLPNSVSPASGMGLSIGISVESSGLVDSLSMALYDGAALYNSVAQAKADYVSGKAKLDTDLQSSAAQNGPKTSF